MAQGPGVDAGGVVPRSNHACRRRNEPRPAHCEHELIYARFFERKRASDERLAGLKASLREHVRLNKALRVGRVDPLVVAILDRLAASRRGEHFRVIGTHAVYAYEAASSIRFDTDAVATRDIDLLWDTRKRVQFATRLSKIDSSMLGVLKKVDPSFRIRNAQKYTSDDEGDFWVAQAPNAHLLLDSSPFSAVIVASNGGMARMNTLHPLAFSKFKRWMAARPDRDASKRGRDALQARVVDEAVRKYLPQWAERTALPSIPD